MITTTTLVLGLLAIPQDVEPGPAPSEAAAKIKFALEQGTAPAASALDEFGRIAAKEVTAAVAPALKHKDQAVQLAAVKALRYNGDESAFTELFRVRGAKAVMSRPEVAAEYYLALGQHRNEKALPFMLKDLRAKGRRDKVIGPRLLALGRMRDRATVDALVKFLRAHRGNSREAITSLVVLTGRNEGDKSVGWARWWKANRTTFELPAEEPKLDRRHAKTWTRVWALPGTQPTKKKTRRKKTDPESKPGVTEKK